VAVRYFEPLGSGWIAWLTPDAGGRPNGPPEGSRYAATAVLELGGEREVIPDWPDEAERFSIGFNLHDEWSTDGRQHVEFDFLARELVLDRLRAGSHLLILEGWQVVAELDVLTLQLPSD
jgi:hypothetical protein